MVSPGERPTFQVIPSRKRKEKGMGKKIKKPPSGKKKGRVVFTKGNESVVTRKKRMGRKELSGRGGP